MLDFSLIQKAQLAEITARARQEFFYHTTILYDDVDATHPLQIQAFVERLYQRLANAKIFPQRLGLLLIASGDGDSHGRAQSYRLMRLLWEELGCARGEVGFLRHTHPLLPEQFERCAREQLTWVMVPQMCWRQAYSDEARAIWKAFSQTHPDVRHWILLDPIGVSTLPPDCDVVAGDLAAWLQQRVMAFWQARREKIEVKTPSAKRGPAPKINRLHGPGISGPRPHGQSHGETALMILRDALRKFTIAKASAGSSGTYGPQPPPPRMFLLKSPGTVNDRNPTHPVALDALLSALPGQAILIEGHTSSRNLGGASWDWVTDSQAHRRWIAEQDVEYLRRTGLGRDHTQAQSSVRQCHRSFLGRAMRPSRNHPSTSGNLRCSVAFSRPGKGHVPQPFFGPSRRALSQLCTL